MSANLPPGWEAYSKKESSPFSCELEPIQLQAGEEVRVHVKNLGDRSDEFTIRGSSRQISFLPKKKESVKLQPGQSATISFTLQPKQSSLIGSKNDLGFRILVQTSRGNTQALKGKFHSQAILSPRQVLILCLLFIFTIFIVKKTRSANGASIAIFATKTPTPTITPTPTTTPSPTPQPHAGETLYLSFDDGPSIWTSDILAVLAKYNVKATFFIVRQQVEDYTGVILAEERAGHTIAHHTWSHISVNGIGFDAFAEQIYLTNAALPIDAATCIRLPFADEGYFTEDYASEMGLKVIWWDIDPLDWQSPGRQNIEYTVLSEAADGKIILLHDGGGNRAQTVAALDTILQELTAQGYRFETLCN